MNAEETLKAYESDTNAKATIRKAVQDAYQNLQPELELVHGYETAGMPTFYNAFNEGYGMGTGADQMTPAARLNAASQDVALKSSAARTARGILDTRRAGMEDLVSDAYNQWQAGYGLASDAWNREMEQQQFEESVRQFNENLELQKYIASKSGTGGGFSFDPSDYINTGGTGYTEDQVLGQVKSLANTLAKGGVNALKTGIGGISFKSTQDAYNYLMNAAAQYGVSLNSDWLWDQLGYQSYVVGFPESTQKSNTSGKSDAASDIRASNYLSKLGLK